MCKIAHASLRKFMPSVCAKPDIEMQFRAWSHVLAGWAHAIWGAQSSSGGGKDRLDSISRVT
jgi:hypothetical protein